jgi:beta-1,2-mannobiose phosphorylase / 1,2-beta-oligomannan phosphorylase
MIEIRREGLILEKTHLDFENEGVLNPAAIRVGNDVHMYYRAVKQGNYSTIGYCRLEGPLNVVERYEEPLVGADTEDEVHGVEDARITCIDGTYYLTYTAYDGINAMGALATSKDLLSFEKKGIIVPQITYTELREFLETDGNVDPRYFEHRNAHVDATETGHPYHVWDKNLVFFPRRINGKLAFMHRMKPDVQLTMVESLDELTEEYWKEYCSHMSEHIMIRPRFGHEDAYIGGGCPPIETKEGWLIIYHGVHRDDDGNHYSACAALFDLDDPMTEIARLPYPLFSPEKTWEKVGEVNNVCFPTGTALFGEDLYIYYGAADERIACVSLKQQDLVNELLNHREQQEQSQTTIHP